MDPILTVIWNVEIVVIALLVILLLAPLYTAAVLMRAGRYQQALFWTRWLNTISRILPSWRGMSALYMSNCYIGLGEFDQAQPYAEQAVAYYARRRQPWLRRYQALSQGCLGVVLTRQGRFQEAERLMDEALASRKLPPAWRATIEVNASSAYINRGRIDDAIRLLDPYIAAPKARPDVRAVAMNNRSLCYYLQGELEEAVALSGCAMQQPVKSKRLRKMTLASHLFYLAESGRTEQAREIEAQLQAHLSELPPYIQGAAYRAMARLALINDNLDRARDFAEQAARLDANPNALAGALLIQAEVFAARHNAHRAAALCDAILRSDALDFYKRKATLLKAEGEKGRRGVGEINADASVQLLPARQ